MIEKTLSSSTITKDDWKRADGPFEVTVMRGVFVAGQRKKSTKQRREILNQVSMDLSKDAQAQKLAYNIGLKRLSHGLDVWTELLSNDTRIKMKSIDMDSWPQINIDGVINSHHGDKCSVVFATTVSWIWRWRNDIAFTGMEATQPGKIEQIREYSKESNIVFANLQHGRNSANNQDVIL
nr:uncharacterized protein LOC109169788 isoform X1 [Ipomoea batatas]